MWHVKIHQQANGYFSIFFYHDIYHEGHEEHEDTYL